MFDRLKKILHIMPKKNNISVYEKIDTLFESLPKEIILVEFGTDLLKFGEVTSDIIGTIREEIKEDCGFIMPPVKIQDNKRLQENAYKIYIRNNAVSQIFVLPTEKGIREEFYESMKSTIYENLEYLFTSELAEKYINTVQKNNNWLIWNISNVLSVVDIKIILTEILSKGKSIGDINYIFEKIGDNILGNGEYQDCLKRFNPHTIAKNIIKTL